MKYTVSVEAWISIEAQDQEEAWKKGMDMFSRGMKAVEDAGGEWAMLEPDCIEDEVGWGG